MSELVFKGKEFVYNHHLAIPFRPLTPIPERSIGEPRLDGNLVVHGDNLHGLKSLLPSLAGQVDCIVIDPPYNTGNENWCYNDNVNSPVMREWLDSNPVGIEDSLRHDKWCAMMYPRLRLLHELLSDAGSFWMTIDDHEVHRARSVLDEVFGPDRFIACCVWQKRYSRENREAIGDVHDYILVYAKYPGIFKALRNKVSPTEEQLEVYSNEDEAGRRWRPIPMTAQGHRRNQMYKIVSPAGVVHEPPEGRCWGMIEPEFNKLREMGRIWFGKDGRGQPNVIRYADEIEGFVPWTWWPSDEVGHTDEAKKEMHAIFGREDAFPTPKPLRLLSRIVEIATRRDSIVLDSFAGSGTTAHAVLAANRKDGGHRRFVLVECEDYADTLTAERVRRAITGYAFHGTQREELLRARLTFASIRNPQRLLEKVDGLLHLHGPDFDRITKEVEGEHLVVTGERDVDEQVPALGGEFTFCALGPAIDLDALLTGEQLPTSEALGSVLFHMATSRAFTGIAATAADFASCLGDADDTRVWLIYEPHLDFLKSTSAALTLQRAKALRDTRPDARHLVFAPARFVSQKVLRDEGVAVEFAPLPFALFRVERG